ncbi:hypothetical protein AT959_17165 [Dechloromonas denitrificans]|uniref:Phosphate starvation-inducible protein PsiF n=1 Tax=Dechloromonas denitrificans TaxID=281362 RepID=A0A133XFC7_9RHOO|nr:PsiF family protein [Dechloromonas denitrificans]KXB29662.1 hypothetical protein AT959_17165 [Dechloromonas denitrificans]
MIKLIALLAVVMSASSVYAADDCAARAAEKKLAGAAKTSFMKKCEADAMGPEATACEATAKEKKLAGAAKNSFMKKCVADAQAAK